MDRLTTEIYLWLKENAETLVLNDPAHRRILAEKFADFLESREGGFVRNLLIKNANPGN